MRVRVVFSTLEPPPLLSLGNSLEETLARRIRECLRLDACWMNLREAVTHATAGMTSFAGSRFQLKIHISPQSASPGIDRTEHPNGKKIVRLIHRGTPVTFPFQLAVCMPYSRRCHLMQVIHPTSQRYLHHVFSVKPTRVSSVAESSCDETNYKTVGDPTSLRAPSVSCLFPFEVPL